MVKELARIQHLLDPYSSYLTVRELQRTICTHGPLSHSPREELESLPICRVTCSGLEVVL